MKKKIRSFEIWLFQVFLFLTLTAINGYAQEFKLHENGVTVTCKDAQPGDTATIFGETYEAVDRDLLIQRRDEGADLSKVCTSSVTDMSVMFYSISTFNADISS